MNIEKKDLNELLFNFLETIYVFQQLETEFFDVSWQDIYLIKKIRDYNELTVTEIANILKVPLFQASRIIQKLCDKGIIVKNKEETNKRIVLVSLSKKGFEIIENIDDYHFNLIKENINVLDINEFNGIMSGITKLKKLLALENKNNMD